MDSRKFVACLAVLAVSIPAFYSIQAWAADLHRGEPLRDEEGFKGKGKDEERWWGDYSLSDGKTNERWLGLSTPISAEITDSAGADRFMSRAYVDMNTGRKTQLDNRIGVYVAYSESYAYGINNGALHFPGLCFKGAGWEIVTEEAGREIEIPGYFRDEKVRATYYLFYKPETNQYRLVLYWMQNGEEVVDSRASGKLYTLMKVLMGSRIGYLAQVRLDCFLLPLEAAGPDGKMKPARTLEDAEKEAYGRLVEFGRAFLPNVLAAKYLPVPKETVKNDG